MKNIFFVLLVVMAAVGCQKEKTGNLSPEAIVVSASGDITAKLNEFRTLLGDVLNTTPGQTSGRREINWDGVPDIYATQKIPSDFFNPVAPGSSPALQRGFRYAAAVDARISSNAFADFDASNGTEFSSFSGAKTFSAVSSNLWSVDFEVAGQAVAASVKGFGAVFSDVDNASSVSVEYFSGDRSLGIFSVPVKTTGTHSFLGVYFPKEKVTKVRIKQGDAVIATGVKDITSGGNKDLVVMDDFLYDEPKAIQ
ncbi:MAG TPA: hypothetical protein VIZ28_05940 [Chitinophagaceae bacterium]